MPPLEPLGSVMTPREKALQAHAERTEALSRIYERFAAFTMIPRESYVANLTLAQRFSSAPGAVVECGTWKGGMIAGIATLLGPGREYWLFDSFAGLPPAKPIDGEAALRWQADTAAPTYFDNCTAAETDAAKAMELSGVSDYRICKGWFRNTLRAGQFPGGISLLRIDADWYDSTMEVLEPLFPQVNPGGAILIDDYYQWDGCAKAVHDYLSRHGAVERIDSHGGVCFIAKR
jgi:O-methyltransferase